MKEVRLFFQLRAGVCIFSVDSWLRVQASWQASILMEGGSSSTAFWLQRIVRLSYRGTRFSVAREQAVFVSLLAERWVGRCGCKSSAVTVRPHQQRCIWRKPSVTYCLLLQFLQSRLLKLYIKKQNPN